MHLQSEPLVRLTMECAVTAAWLSVTPNAGNAARHEDARSRLVTMRAIFGDPERVDQDLLDEATRSLEQLRPHESGAARHFEQKCKSLAGGDTLYSFYRILSGYSHAGVSLTELYLKKENESPANPYGIALLEKPDFLGSEASLVHQVAMLAMAMKAWDNITATHPMEAELDSIAGDFGIGLPSSSSYLPLSS